jgi:hypothetical protein
VEAAEVNQATELEVDKKLLEVEGAAIITTPLK